MPPAIKNVAIAGATGNVGARVLSALLKLGFNVTVLTRTPKPFHAAVRVEVVDFTSVASLTSTLTGQDAVIDTTFSSDIETPLRLIDAAVAAGVYRFITSDFGLDPEITGVRDMPVFGRKKASYEAVKKHAAQNGLTYTLVACGGFLDWSLSTGFLGLNFTAKKASIYGDGNNVVPWSSLEDVGTATANVLIHPEETLNRVVYIHSVYLSQNEILAATKEVLGAGKWQVEYLDMELLLARAMNDLKTGNISTATFEVQIQYCLADEGLAHPWARDDNALLGLKEWDLEEVKGLIKEVVNKTD